MAADHDPAREPWYAPELRWRALMSSIDPGGGQFIWFVGSEVATAEDLGGDAKQTTRRTVFFTVLTRDPRGLLDASGSLDAKAEQAPPGRRIGALHFILGAGAQPVLSLLEAPLAVALSALRGALALNWATGAATPMGYRLFSPLIWLAEASQPDEDEAAGVDTAPPAPDLALSADELTAALEHPAFYGWFGDVADAELTSAQKASYARRLRAMSRWLAIAGDQAIARHAATLAYHLDTSTPEASSILAAARSRLQDSQPR
jgi:hypothetical protein